MSKSRIIDFQTMKKSGEKISMITAYDSCTAEIVDEAGVDIVLVGDSLGNVIQGEKDTLSVTIEEMIYHTLIVSRGIKNAHLASDMPFMSYQASEIEAVDNAGRLVKEGKAESVKLEINEVYIDTIYAISKAGIPVISHIGLCPQSVHVMGGYRVQGRTREDADHILKLAKLSEDAGAFMLVLESIPEKLAQLVTKSVNIPTVGIGAGKHCDGQVLVFHDMVGLTKDPQPKFVKKFAEGRKLFKNAAEKYIDQVKKGKFPGKNQSYV
ncbi:MAG: 3-methyl-2-oxobutanoate hydroxymethyltransferase [Thermodesulfobacteriota bacterium]